jgi:hypothetical protein
MFKKYFSMIIIECFISIGLKSQQLAWIDTINYSISADGIASDNSGGIYITGKFSTGNAYVGVYLNKYSDAGNLLWSDTTKNTVMAETGGVSIDNNNNVYTIVKYGANSKIGNVVYPPGMYLVKRSPAWQVLWIINQNYDQPFDIKTDSANNIFVSAAISNSIKKYNSSGNLQSTIPKVGYISFDGSNNLYILSDSLQKYEPNGNLLWTYVGVGSGSKLIVDTDGNCYIIETGSNFYTPLTKISPAGELVWCVSLSFSGRIAAASCENDNLVGFCDNDNNIYLAGGYGADQNVQGVELRKIDGGGNTLNVYQIPNSQLIRPTGITKKGNNIYISAYKILNYQACLLKITGPDISTSIKESQKQGFLSISPNPSSQAFALSYKNEEGTPADIKVFDQLGKVVYTKSIKRHGGELNEIIDLTNFGKGVYLLEITGAKTKGTRRLVVD